MFQADSFGRVSRGDGDDDDDDDDGGDGGDDIARLVPLLASLLLQCGRRLPSMHLARPEPAPEGRD